MKLITAIIRPEKLNDVLEALFTAEITVSPSAAPRVTAARPRPSRPIVAPR